MSYVYQTFSVGQVLTAAQVQQIQDDARDHVHGQAGVVDYVYAKTGVRQAIQACAIDTGGRNAAIGIGAGLRITLDGTPTSFIISASGGFDAYGGPVETMEVITADSSDIIGADLPVSNISYIYRSLASAWGSTLILPQYGTYFDRTQNAILNYEGTNGSTSIIDAFGNTWTAAGNAQISTARSKFGSSSLLLDGTGDYVQTTEILTIGQSSWQMETWFWIVTNPAPAANEYIFCAVNAAGFGANLYLNNTAGTIKLQMDLSGNGTTNNITSTLGTNTTWTTGQWNKVRLVFDALGGTYKAYLSLNGAAETADISISSTSQICAISTLRLGSSLGGSGFNGNFDGFRFVQGALKNATETPAAAAPAVNDNLVHFFSIPEMKMYEVTSASAAGGTNPGMTARTRTFAAQVDSGAATITAVRNYAIQGRYDSFWQDTFPTVATFTSFSHNIGVIPERAQLLAKFKGGATAGGMLNGETIVPLTSVAAAEYEPFHLPRTNKSIGFTTGANQAIAYVSETAGTIIATPTLANWSYRVIAERGW